MNTLYWLSEEKQGHFNHFVESRYERFMSKGKRTKEEAMFRSRRFAFLQIDLLDNDDEFNDDFEQIFIPDWFAKKTLKVQRLCY